jgi:predicted ATPase
VSRFRQLDTIHEFAAEKLAASGEESEIERRHAAYFLAMVERAAPHIRGLSSSGAGWGRFERDHDNIRARWIGRSPPPTPTPRSDRFAMWRYWQKRGHLAEAKRRLESSPTQPWSRDDRFCGRG